tara:strand:- start:3651 stop:4472 length:822 start_codon:yes stop_codon:yes gene_type:complete
MAQAPSIQQNNNNNLVTMVCYTANGQPVSVQTSTGSCPMGLFSKPPDATDAFSDADTEDDVVSQEDSSVVCHSPCMMFSGWDNLQSQSVSMISGVCPPSYPFYTEPNCKILPEDDGDDVVSQEDSSVVCHSPCMMFSGSDNQQSQSVSVISGVCPPSYPFYTKPDCEIPEDVQGLMDSYQNQIDALLEDLANSNSSEQVSDLTEQLEALQAQLEASQGGGGGGGIPILPYEPAPKQAGFGNIPTWAIIGGVTLVAIIVIMSSRRQQPVVVKGS